MTEHPSTSQNQPSAEELDNELAGIYMRYHTMFCLWWWLFGAYLAIIALGNIVGWWKPDAWWLAHVCVALAARFVIMQIECWMVRGPFDVEEYERNKPLNAPSWM